MPLDGPVLKQAVDESSMEDVSGPGCIDYGNAEGWGVIKLSAVPGQNPVRAQRCSSEPTSVPALHTAQGFFQVHLACELAGEIPAHDKVIDILKELLDAGIRLVEVRDNRYARSAGPACGQGGSGGVMTIDMKRPRIHDPLAIQLMGLKNEPLIAPAKNRPLSRAIY